VSGERGRQILTHEEVTALLSAVDRDEIAVSAEASVDDRTSRGSSLIPDDLHPAPASGLLRRIVHGDHPR
jgi:hypothetical protein